MLKASNIQYLCGSQNTLKNEVVADKLLEKVGNIVKLEK